MDTNGDFYGITHQQGPNGFNSSGTVYRVTTNGVLTVLAAFNGTNGASPEDGPIAGIDGNFYGTTAAGGSNGFGTVFRITPGGSLTTLFSFNNTNGAFPFAGLVQGSDGTLYGTTIFGGSNLNFGTIFKVTTNGAFTTLHNFHFTDGEDPIAKMIFGNDGNLYGTATSGGSLGGNPFGSGFGTVFRITTNGVLTPIVLFQGTNGANPQAPLALGPDGNLYGTTPNGGPGGAGTIFRVVLTPQLTSITKTPGGSILLSGTGLAGSPYRLLAATNLSAPSPFSTLLTSNVFDTNGTFSFTDQTATNTAARFYRISTP
jgi:uncharacterized repeat protein (TIGR03803 family)